MSIKWLLETIELQVSSHAKLSNLNKKHLPIGNGIFIAFKTIAAIYHPISVFYRLKFISYLDYSRTLGMGFG